MVKELCPLTWPCQLVNSITLPGNLCGIIQSPNSLNCYTIVCCSHLRCERLAHSYHFIATFLKCRLLTPSTKYVFCKLPPSSISTCMFTFLYWSCEFCDSWGFGWGSCASKSQQCLVVVVGCFLDQWRCWNLWKPNSLSLVYSNTYLIHILE